MSKPVDVIAPDSGIAKVVDLAKEYGATVVVGFDDHPPVVRFYDSQLWHFVRAVRAKERIAEPARVEPDAEPRDGLLRAIAGQPLSRRELIIGFIFAVGWFVMDLVQWLDWLFDKLR